MQSSTPPSSGWQGLLGHYLLEYWLFCHPDEGGVVIPKRNWECSLITFFWNNSGERAVLSTWRRKDCHPDEGRVVIPKRNRERSLITFFWNNSGERAVLSSRSVARERRNQQERSLEFRRRRNLAVHHSPVSMWIQDPSCFGIYVLRMPVDLLSFINNILFLQQVSF